MLGMRGGGQLVLRDEEKPRPRPAGRPFSRQSCEETDGDCRPDAAAELGKRGERVREDEEGGREEG